MNDFGSIGNRLKRYLWMFGYRFRLAYGKPEAESFKESIRRSTMILVAATSILHIVLQTLSPQSFRFEGNIDYFAMLFVLPLFFHLLPIRILKTAAPHLLILLMIFVGVFSAIQYLDLSVTLVLFVTILFLTGFMVRSWFVLLYLSITLAASIIILTPIEEIGSSNIYLSSMLVVFSGLLSFLVAKSIENVISSYAEQGSLVNLLYDNTKDAMGGLAHKLKTPLTTLKLQVADLKISSKQSKHIELLINDISEAINEITILSRIQVTTMASKSEIVGLKDLMDGIARDARLLAKNYSSTKSIHRKVKYIESDLKETKVEVQLDQFREMLLNFIDNAIRHSDEKEGVVVEISAVILGPLVLITISDNGIGITPKRLKEVMSRKVKPSKSNSRMGINIARNIINSHGGKIEILSKPGLGTRIEILAPLYTASNQ